MYQNDRGPSILNSSDKGFSNEIDSHKIIWVIIIFQGRNILEKNEKNFLQEVPKSLDKTSISSNLSQLEVFLMKNHKDVD